MRIPCLRTRHLVVALLFLLSVLNYLDRQALSVMAPLLRDRFGFSTGQYSYIVASFLAAYTLGYAFGGRVLDRFGSKRSIAAALSFWSLSGMAHALAASWEGFAICRFLLGLGESFNAPGGTKVIGEWVPAKERGLSMAVFSTGNIAGSVLAPPLVMFLALRFGWQSAFVVTGALGFVWLAAWIRFYELPERHRAITPAEREEILAGRPRPGAARPGAWELLRDRRCQAFLLARLLTDQIPFFFSFWLPEYLHRSRDFSFVSIGLAAWIPYLAADVGGLSGGAISDWLVRRGWRPRDARMRALLTAACITPLAAAAVLTGSAPLALACIALVLAAHSCWIVNLFTAMTETFPPDCVGAVAGYSGIGGSATAIGATLLTGQIAAAYGYVPIFTALSVLHMASYLFLRRLLRSQGD